MHHNRNLWTALVFFLLVLAGAGGGLISCGSLTGRRGTAAPNVILIITDDQPVQSIAYMPNVQKELVEKGIEFTNAYATTPLCCPSRASILTGLFAHNHNVLTNRPPSGGATLFSDASTLPVWLDQAGYQTALMGKYLNNYDALEPAGYVPPGWDVWHAFLRQGENNKGFYYGYSLSENGKVIQTGIEAKDYSTDVLTDKALEFISDNRAQPFFLMLSYYSPHQTYLAAERHRDYFKTNEEFTPYHPENFYESDLTDKPDWVTQLPPIGANHVDVVYQRILRSLMAVDESVGKITMLLDQEGLRDDTLIIYLSDNGMSLGENRVFGKNCPYEACIRIPFIVSYPRLITQRAVMDEFVLNIDLAPTIAELTGATVAEKVDGVSFLPLLAGQQSAWRDAVLIEHFQEFDTVEEGATSIIPTFYGIRTAEWKYVEYDSGEKELYDLKADPFEMSDLIQQPGLEDVIESLHKRLVELKDQ